MRPFPDPSTPLRFTWGTLLLRSPDRVLDTIGAPVTPAGLRVTRALGARHLCQGAAVLLFSGPSAQRRSQWVDQAHGLSMALLAAASPDYRRAGLASLTMASALVHLSRSAGTDRG